MQVEAFRGYVAAIVAALCVVGGGAALIYVWTLPPTDPPRELSLIFGVIGGLIGSGTTFLFVAEGASRATHAAERSFSNGAIAGSAMPEQVAAPLAPLVESTIEPTPQDVDDFTGTTPGAPTPSDTAS